MNPWRREVSGDLMAASPLIVSPEAFRAGTRGSFRPRTIETDITARLGRRYVRIGSLFFSPGQVTKVLHRYAKPLALENDDARFPYSIRGTNTGLNLGGRHFYVFCRHQIVGYDPSKVAIFPRAAHGEQYIGGGTGLVIERDASNDGEEFLDVFGLEIEPDAYGIENLSAEFFPVIDEDCWPNNTVGDLIAYGVPSGLQEYIPPDEDAVSKLAVNFKTVVVSGVHNRASHAVYVHEADMIRTGQFAVDGMSGGPVFHIGRDARGLFIGLAGMIMRAGAEQFHFIDSAFLRQFGET